MKKAIVIGCPGAGKSTFARKLRDKTGLPLWYLDRLFWRADGTSVPREEFDAALDGVLQGDEWIIDGNYGRTLEKRLSCCDTVFLFDLPVESCLAGAAARIGTVREDLPWVEKEFDPDFRQWIEEFPTEQLPGVYQKIEACTANAEIVIFHSHAEADAWLDAFCNEKGETNE
ncbi:MAG: adenylate kinase [Clostridia bacterium]|nr:adenylate kinase [Clostridia bacterium]